MNLRGELLHVILRRPVEKTAARGYTAWDPTSVPFLWETGGTRILCLPAIFFSWTGKALDMKIPLLRSEAKIERAALRLLHLFGIQAESVHATLGCEQEYFLIDSAYFLSRPDLLMTGRTLFGAPSPKGQELEDHYFGTLKERVAVFMTDLEHRAWALGIPLKTRHNEVAPHQFEAAPLFERMSLAVDHNILLMELMRQTAARHQLACLFHEKPFAGINGSGKHCNWSLSTKAGQNLLDPDAFPDQRLPFLVLLTAVLHAKSAHAFSAFLETKTVKALEGILTKEELHARVEIMKHRYCKIMQIETKVLLDAFHTGILPAAIRDTVAPACEHMRKQIDGLELLVDDRLWPSPKYSEMLNVI